jgi:cathepsin F
MMKGIIVVLVVALLGSAFAASVEDQFTAFVHKFNKVYSSDAEYQQRLSVFRSNLALIKQKNAQARAQDLQVEFGVTQFTDMSPAEFKAKVLSKTPAVPNPEWPVAPAYTDEQLAAIPSTFDWREHGAVTPVKNQGDCGSCWSFSTTGNVEGQWFLAGNPLTSLSEQNLVDCDHTCMEYDGEKTCDEGCDGGLQPNAYTYIIGNGGIDTEESYPYEGVDGTCKFSASNVGAKISNYTMVSSNETQMAAYLVEHGPLAIAADAAEWQFYFGGVFDWPCGSNLDHGILIVGFGNQTSIVGRHTPYWIVKNSWGPTWGEAGYLKIERGDGKCGLNTFVSSSIIN